VAVPSLAYTGADILGERQGAQLRVRGVQLNFYAEGLTVGNPGSVRPGAGVLLAVVLALGMLPSPARAVDLTAVYAPFDSMTAEAHRLFDPVVVCGSGLDSATFAIGASSLTARAVPGTFVVVVGDPGAELRYLPACGCRDTVLLYAVVGEAVDSMTCPWAVVCTNARRASFRWGRGFGF